MGPRRMLAGLGAAVVTMLACCAAVLLVARVGPEWGSGPSLANELLDSGAGGEPLERAERARGSQLADLFDSPLVLAKQKIDGVLREDSSGLAAGEAAAGLQDAQNLAEATTGGEHGAPCTSLKCDNGVYVNNYVSEGQRRVKDALSPPVAGAGDLSAVDQQRYLDAEDAFAGIGALDADTMEAPGKPANMAAITAALKSKLSALKQRFREIRAAFENGPAKTLSINVKPRGPRGPPGVPGDIGPQGNKGPVGSLGPPGRKGPRGPMGRPGKLGRKGKTGPAGSIGKPGTIGGKGAQGATGPRGFPGPPGSRGLPGAAGAPGTNGKDGPPGPPGRNSPEGPPGKPGRKGIRGPAGQSGANGKNGPMGWKGQSGTTGEPGFHGPTGAAGLQGAGPPRAKATLKGLDAAWPKMDCWTMSETCAKLGVYNNLCGKCEPLCKRCGAKSGFKLSNSKGLRYKGLSWDDNSMYAGSVTVRNICLLARYGNGGKFAGKAESIISAKSYGQSAGAESEPHWYGNCKHGDTAQKKCCTNAFLAVSGVKSWDLFSTGNQCGGDLDKDSVTSSVTCIFSEKSLETESKPPKPRDGDSKGGFLVSGGEVDESTYRSKNGKCEFVLDGDGALLVQKDDKTIWQKDLKGVQDSPLKMVMGKDGNLAVYDGSGRSVWDAGTTQSGNRVQLTDKCCLTVFDSRGSCSWSSCGC